MGATVTIDAGSTTLAEAALKVVAGAIVVVSTDAV